MASREIRRRGVAEIRLRDEQGSVLPIVLVLPCVCCETTDTAMIEKAILKTTNKTANTFVSVLTASLLHILMGDGDHRCRAWTPAGLGWIAGSLRSLRAARTVPPARRLGLRSL
jgi:hypothetical protein